MIAFVSRRIFPVAAAIVFICGACSPVVAPLPPSENEAVKSSVLESEKSSEEVIAELLLKAYGEKLHNDLERIRGVKGEWVIGEFEFTNPQATKPYFNQEKADMTLSGERLTIDDNYAIVFQGVEYQIGKFLSIDKYGIEMGLKKVDGSLTRFGLFWVGDKTLYFWAGEWFNENEYNVWGMYELKRVV